MERKDHGNHLLYDAVIQRRNTADQSKNANLLVPSGTTSVSSLQQLGCPTYPVSLGASPAPSGGGVLKVSAMQGGGMRLSTASAGTETAHAARQDGCAGEGPKDDNPSWTSFRQNHVPLPLGAPTSLPCGSCMHLYVSSPIAFCSSVCEKDWGHRRWRGQGGGCHSEYTSKDLPSHS